MLLMTALHTSMTVVVVDNRCWTRWCQTRPGESVLNWILSLFLCICQRSGWRHYIPVFMLFMRVFVRCVPNVVSTISLKLLDIFSWSFQHWCILGRE